jgi:hypothetical protein
MSGVVFAPETTTDVVSPQRANLKRTDDASTLAKDLLGVSLVPEMTVHSVPDATSPPSIDQKGLVKHTLEECVMLRRYFHKARPRWKVARTKATTRRKATRKRSSRRSTTAS